MSLAYYEHNAAAYARRSRERSEALALREFCSRLPAGARVLDAGCGSGRDLAALAHAGFQAEGIDACEELLAHARLAAPGARVWRGDLLLASLERAAYQGIWCNHVLSHLSAVGCQRVLASFFAALVPGGVLFVSTRVGEGVLEDRHDDPQGPVRQFHLFAETDFASLLRQHGFQLLATGRDQNRAERIAYIARRI